MLKKSSNTPEGFDDDELKKAIKMSLAENDLDLDSHHQVYPSLAMEDSGAVSATTSGHYDEDLRKAIQMSLETTDSKKSEPETADEIRRRRLEFLSKNNSNNTQ
jgi:hypothetical protein